MKDIEIPLRWPTKSHRRYYEKRAKKMEGFLRRVIKTVRVKDADS